MGHKIYDWQNQIKNYWKYEGGNDPCSDIQYVKDRKEFFAENGNGWWYGWHLVKPDKRPIDMWNGKKFKTNEEI